MNFDEEPEGDPHGECTEEIHKLRAEVKKEKSRADANFASAEQIETERDKLRADLDELNGLLAESVREDLDKNLDKKLAVANRQVGEMRNLLQLISREEDLTPFVRGRIEKHITNEKRAEDR